MTMTYMKKATPQPAARSDQIQLTVREMLDRLESEGESATRDYSMKLDSWSPETFLVSDADVAKAKQSLPITVTEDIEFALNQVRSFAKLQLDSLNEFEAEIHPGLIVGQKLIPVEVAGCYVPGGRFAHVASAAMSIATAKAAGVDYVTACSPPRGEGGIHPATLYGMSLAGADAIMCLGGVQAIGAMAFGHFTGRPANILAGPGNSYVAEAKRLLFGRVGIDVVAGPTEALIIADATADPYLVTVDLVSQAEHGLDSSTVLVTTSAELGEKVLGFISEVVEKLPSNSVAAVSWDQLGEVIIATDREEAARIADQYASEHVEVHAADLDWWLSSLKNYGSLFLGEQTTVTYGDKTSGPNHILPTRGASRYTGGLWVGKFVKTVTYQKMTESANLTIGQVSARLSRLEGMEGHALAADVRLRKYFPSESFDTKVH